MTTDTFAFVIHPIDAKRDVSRKYPALGRLPVWLIEFLSVFYPPVYISEISGICSAATGAHLRGWFVACPLTPRLMLKLPPAIVYRKIIQTGRLAERLGAQILGLGAFTSVVGDGGKTVARELSIPVTTGDSYTVAMAVRAIRQAARRMDITLQQSTLAVVGATGTIGSVCAQMLAPDVRRTILVGRNEERLRATADNLVECGAQDVHTTTDMRRISQAECVITVSNALEAIVGPEHLRRGAVVCDVARPRDVSRQVAQKRGDVLVIEGGMVRVPGTVDFGFDFGFPAGMAYACMAETMVLALDDRFQSFSLGKQVQLAQVRAIDKMAAKHGFRLGGLRSFERAVSEAEITNTQLLSGARKRKARHVPVPSTT